MYFNGRKIILPIHEFQETFHQSSGPGGQNVNKVATAVRLSWNVAESALPEEVKKRLLERLFGKLTIDGVLAVTSQTHRSQLQNREAARERLLALIRGALHTPRVRRATRPTRGSVKRRLDSKTKHSIKKSLRRKDHDE
ncbi:MAG: alternative ribosome rescue aminoacyl-tRNA hydrolase ArfB [Victivallaceae bacterium]|nr:alternative ribosome rescue aminoacyl-tRNA hydrolase ArfB [Victivallaceae bacterium]MDD4181718.1 alternative ribosome rescue aminoacyl-tRNA hydrolase ArfB [Victivallaceae bacterium]